MLTSLAEFRKRRKEKEEKAQRQTTSNSSNAQKRADLPANDQDDRKRPAAKKRKRKAADVMTDIISGVSSSFAKKRNIDRVGNGGDDDTLSTSNSVVKQNVARAVGVNVSKEPGISNEKTAPLRDSSQNVRTRAKIGASSDVEVRIASLKKLDIAEKKVSAETASVAAIDRRVPKKKAQMNNGITGVGNASLKNLVAKKKILVEEVLAAAIERESPKKIVTANQRRIPKKKKKKAETDTGNAEVGNASAKTLAIAGKATPRKSVAANKKRSISKTEISQKAERSLDVKSANEPLVIDLVSSSDEDENDDHDSSIDESTHSMPLITSKSVAVHTPKQTSAQAKNGHKQSTPKKVADGNLSGREGTDVDSLKPSSFESVSKGKQSLSRTPTKNTSAQTSKENTTQAKKDLKRGNHGPIHAQTGSMEIAVGEKLRDTSTVGVDNGSEAKKNNAGIEKEKGTDMDVDFTHGSSSTVVEEEDLTIDPEDAVCWGCGTLLDSENDESDEGFSHFVHLHPLLQVPSCSVCADKAYMVEDNIQAMIESKSIKKVERGGGRDVRVVDICSWCADEYQQGNNLLLCDFCPRGFCDHCVSLAHGSGSKGDGAVKNLMMVDDLWSCLDCKPTRILEAMRTFWAESIAKEEQALPISDNESATKDMDCEGDDESVIYLLDKLSSMEDLLEATALMLETEGIDKHRKELESMFASNSESVPNQLQGELDDWVRKKKDQYARCSDDIGILQDDLDSKGIDLGAFYNKREKTETVVKSTNDEDNWKKAADKELDKRDIELGFQKGAQRGASGWNGSEDNYLELDELPQIELNRIEDINSTEEALKQLERIVQNKLHGPKSASSNSLIDQQTIRNFKKIIPRDDRELKELKAKVQRRNECNDKKMERNLDRKENTALKTRNGSVMKVISRHTKRLNRKSEQEKPKKSRQRNMNRRNRTLPVSDYQVDQEYGNAGSTFEDSDCVLTPQSPDAPSAINIAVAAPLAKLLKPHQIDGIKFMWNNTFGDVQSQIGEIPPSKDTNTTARGCILAHNMGLGKTLQVIALLHTLLTHPKLVKKESGSHPARIISRVLLTVPVNTLENWKAEFSKWIVNLPKITLFDFSSTGKNGRELLVKRWAERGGVMIITYDTLARAVKNAKDNNFLRIFQNPGADAIVVDEGHLMLKNKKSEISKVLSSMATPRRIVLTGTPLQNNLLEFYRMADWIRPGCLGSESAFEKKFALKIMSSLTSDASLETQQLGEQLLRELFDTLSPYIQRLDSSVLKRELPHIQQAVIHVRQTKAQMKLYRAFKKFQKNSTSNNFLEQYSKLFPVNNHPGALLFRGSGSSNRQAKPHNNKGRPALSKNSVSKAIPAIDIAKVTVKSETFRKPTANNEENGDQVISNSQGSVEVIIIDDSSDDENNEAAVAAEVIDDAIEGDQEEDWWKKVVHNLDDIQNGGKAILLLQILAHSEMIGDKVVVFSQCLKTLDFLESIITSPDWGSKLPGVANLTNDNRKFGSWEGGRDYLRIDGQTSASERGNLINQFNKKNSPTKKRTRNCVEKEADKTVKAFLISSRAGSVGINLVAANRVVIFDSAWNPVIDQQALYRCYRYGQVKPVYAYRFLTESTMEEKVYSRSLNKTCLAARVIDQKDPKRNFTQRELSDIMAIDNWAQCDRCEKWRMLPPTLSVAEVDALPDKWFCEMNVYDALRSKCSAKERDNKYMSKFFLEQVLRATLSDVQESESNLQDVQGSQLSQSSHISIGSQNLPRESVRESVDSRLSPEDDEHIANTQRDEILTGLTQVQAPKSGLDLKGTVHHGISSKSLITKFYFHDSMMKDASSGAIGDLEK